MQKYKFYILVAFIFCFLASALNAQIEIDIPPPKKTDLGGSKMTSVLTRHNSDIVRFKNGNILNVRLVSIDTAEGLAYFEALMLLKPVAANLKNLLSIEHCEKPIKNFDAPVSLQITNGDVISGNLISLDRDTLIFEAGYCGKLTIPLKMISEINMKASEELIYSGPNDEKEWIKSKRFSDRGSFEVKNNVLTLSSYVFVTNDLQIPGRCRIDFTVSKLGDERLRFYFFCKVTDRDFGGYSLNISSSYLELERVSDRGGTSELREMSLSGDERKRKKDAHYTIFADAAKKRIVTFIDGKIIKDYVETRDSFGDGKKIAFACESSHDINVSDIVVSKWNGILPFEDAYKASSNSDCVYFINEDKASGRVLYIKDGKMKFENDFAALDIPLDKIRSLKFSTEKQEKARLNKNDVKLIFYRGGELTFELLGLKDGKIRGRSENFGEAEFDLSAFKKIAFNIYDENQKTDSDEEE